MSETLMSGESAAAQLQEQARLADEARARETSPPVDPPAPAEPEAKQETEQTYMLQRREPAGGTNAWVDVGSVVVAPRTRRNTVLSEGLRLYPGHVPGEGDTFSFRVLDQSSADEIPVTVAPPEPSAPVLRIGS